jgi:serine/threonine-protein kinase HipA
VNRCPITYENCGKHRYSREGLRLLAPVLKNLHDLPLTAEEQRFEAARRAGRMSIQGVQPKLSAVLNIKGEAFNVVDHGGTFILKPPSGSYPELPENEDLTMHLAAAAGIRVPLHGLLHAKGQTKTYFIRRFDRGRKGKKFAVEDFAQLLQKTRDTKYDSSMEQVAKTLDYCSFPIIESKELFRRVVFCYLVGNEDMHLKNFSLITRDGKTTLAPAYDLLNSSLVLSDPEEIALPLNGKKRNLTKNDFLTYFAKERLALPEKSILAVLSDIRNALTEWERLIERSFLSEEMKGNYRDLLEQRLARLGVRT